MMKKILLSSLLLSVIAVKAGAQEIFKEVKRIQKTFYNVKYNDKLKLDERRVASFQWDAIEYMLMKGKDSADFTERQLGEQTNAMMEFVQLYFKRLSEKSKSKEREVVMAKFKNASLGNSLFGDMDREMVQAYVDNPLYTTPFSLDTDWVKALQEIRSMSW